MVVMVLVKQCMVRIESEEAYYTFYNRSMGENEIAIFRHIATTWNS